MEGANIGFKTISSQANFLIKNFKFQISGLPKKNIRIYSIKVLKNKLSITRRFLCLIYQVYINEFSYCWKKFWQNIIATQIVISIEKYKEKVESFQGINNSAEKIKYFSLISGKKFKQTKKLNQNIIRLNFKKRTY